MSAVSRQELRTEVSLTVQWLMTVDIEKETYPLYNA